jgi:membrane associated rhomboid family serine protease
MRIGFPSPTPVVKYLLIINIAVFVITWIASLNDSAAEPNRLSLLIGNWLPLDTTSLSTILQPWRLITYQFMHDGFMHILFNMLGLYFLGPTLEHHWGSKRFLFFYLMCGVVGALCYILLSLTNILHAGGMVGASGAILGMLAACAIMFPHFVVIFFIFPVPIRIASVIMIVLYLANVISRGPNAGGDAAHLGGMAAGAIYVFLGPTLDRFRLKRKSSSWERKMREHRRLEAEVDRILDKVHHSGLQSLTRNEKQILEKATRLEQTRNKLQ